MEGVADATPVTGGPLRLSPAQGGGYSGSGGLTMGSFPRARPGDSSSRRRTSSTGLAFDHEEIVRDGLEPARSRLEYIWVVIETEESTTRGGEGARRECPPQGRWSGCTRPYCAVVGEQQGQRDGVGPDQPHLRSWTTTRPRSYPAA